MDQQARLTDLVPRGLGVYFLLLVVGLAIVAGLEALYGWMPRVADLTTDGRVAAFDLDGEGSLAVWFSSMTLAAAGWVAVLVFTVRRHRRDDYSGRYRIWLWAALCWFLLSLDETASLHEGFKELMTHSTGTGLFGDGSIWWVTAYFFLLGGVGIRLVIDMRECWLSTGALAATAVCYLVAVVTQLGWLLPASGARGVMVEEGAEMVGDWFLFLAMALHARHVILDAEGRFPVREGRRSEGARESRPGVGGGGEVPDDPESSSTDEGEAERGGLPGDRPLKVHPPRGVPRPAGMRPASTASPPEGSDSASTGAGGQRKLTKAEKKALRKKLRQMARQRQRQSA